MDERDYRFLKDISVTLVQHYLEENPQLTNRLRAEDLQAKVTEAARAHKRELEPHAFDALVGELHAKFQTVIGEVRELTDLADQRWEPWLPARSGSVEWHYWDRYTEHLERGPMSEASRTRLEETTFKALGRLGDPKRSGAWDRRGLVVGLVQSGKTSHYIGLINRALDTGYKVVVILTGFTETLREQTQERADDGTVGLKRTKDHDVWVPTGFGVYDRHGPRPTVGTTQKSDFKSGNAENFGVNIHPGCEPVVFVVKKNARVLANLLEWIESNFRNYDEAGQGFVKDVPLLVIDDESDVGSVDTKKGNIIHDEADEEHDPSKINQLIRKLLNLFDQSSYVGYTATPFANVLIHPSGKTNELGDDLFPRSFIHSLPTPSNHIGPSKVFGGESENETLEELPIIKTIGTDGPEWIPQVHKKHYIPGYDGGERIPGSLREALLSFILTCSARKIREKKRIHNSMLIHVTRFVDVQEHVKDQVQEALSVIQKQLRNNTGNRVLLEELRELWHEFTETTRTICERSAEHNDIYDNPTHEWEEIREQLRSAAESIEVVAVNGRGGDLDYKGNDKHGLNVVAIGGDKLSRGLTLEGLSISYFMRSSRMYDTLMQMGRWFGYRTNYLDLCRLYTTSSLKTWFRHIADATNELREELKLMASNNATPKDYGLRIKNHPVMIPTSRIKMRHALKRQVTFQGTYAHSRGLHRDASSTRKNWDALGELVRNLEGGRGTPTTSPGGTNGPQDRNLEAEVSVCWNQVPAEVVTSFLSRYMTEDGRWKFRTKYLKKYIEKLAAKGMLDDWTILIAGSSDRNNSSARELGNSTKFRTVKRKVELAGGDGEGGSSKYCIYNTLLDPTDETVDLDENAMNRALEKTQKAWNQDSGEAYPEKPTRIRIRGEREPEKGLMVIYAIEPNEDNSKEFDPDADPQDNTPIVGCVLIFPFQNQAQDEQVDYVVNTTYIKEEGQE